ncbi:TIGR04104 family putative zinc finger protein [Alkalihalophilus sp. As8PL]|uniref:TIGR04104 family putative zinc finger protein n=1 Tax=Alkalihalophilus sp. As8PL TaxID=3237103 RepID=A0AB39BVF4_9BACI
MSLYSCCKCSIRVTWKRRLKSMFLNDITCENCNHKNEITIYSRILMNLLMSTSIMGSSFYLFSILENIFLSILIALIFTSLTIPLYPFLVTYVWEDG